MAFIWVGIAYFLTAIIAPIIIFKIKAVQSNSELPSQGLAMVTIRWNFKTIGALGVLLAFGKMPSPAYVPVIMSIIFAGAPIVNAVVSTTKEGNWAHVKAPFLIGIALAAIGGYLNYQERPQASTDCKRTI